jgi:hypothetical protein
METLAATLLAFLLVAHAGAVENANVPAADQGPTVRETEPFAAKILVRNPYDRAVRVKLLDASCSCAHLDLHDHFILPKAATTLDVTVDNANRSGDQSLHVSIFLTDPEFEPIEVDAYWKVRASVQVDALPPGADPRERPADRGWQDVYRFAYEGRPDEPQRLVKRIRLSCPDGEAPKDGLAVTGIDYTGKLLAFTVKPQDNGSILIVARAKEGLDALPEGEFHEEAAVHTNHPDKPTILLRFDGAVSMQVGQKPADPLGR